MHAHREEDTSPQPGRGDDDVEGSCVQATASDNGMRAGGQPLATPLYCQRVRIMASPRERAAPYGRSVQQDREVQISKVSHGISVVALFALHMPDTSAGSNGCEWSSGICSTCIFPRRSKRGETKQNKPNCGVTTLWRACSDIGLTGRPPPPLKGCFSGRGKCGAPIGCGGQRF